MMSRLYWTPGEAGWGEDEARVNNLLQSLSFRRFRNPPVCNRQGRRECVASINWTGLRLPEGDGERVITTVAFGDASINGSQGCSSARGGLSAGSVAGRRFRLRRIDSLGRVGYPPRVLLGQTRTKPEPLSCTQSSHWIIILLTYLRCYHSRKPRGESPQRAISHLLEDNPCRNRIA
jgi:hypothetical protein